MCHKRVISKINDRPAQSITNSTHKIQAAMMMMKVMATPRGDHWDAGRRHTNYTDVMDKEISAV